jgi:corrinoid protein of di/trimethylamine methyltransferase
MSAVLEGESMSNDEELLEDIKQSIIDGDDKSSVPATQAAVEAGIDPLAILNSGLMAGADVVGKKFEAGVYFLPQLMLAGRALKAAMAIVEPKLKEIYAHDRNAASDTGVVVMATIQTDIHDIGKNIVSSMLTASGFEVHDLGVDVPIKSIIAKAQELDANIIGCSALLTTSMPFMRDLVNLLEAMGERGRFKVMVGGASVTPEFAEKIGADGTAQNAVKAVQLAKRFIRQQRVEKGAMA